MIVEVSGAGFHNMGAELMLVAAREKLLSWDFVDDVVVSFRTGRREQRERAGLGSVLRLDSTRRHWANRMVTIGALLTPTPLLRAVGLVKPREVGAMVNASGFALGDQWGAARARRLGRMFGSYASAGKPVVLLPQAFGPFAVAEVASAAARALDEADLVFARDPESLAHLKGLGLSKPTIDLAPDFTNLVEPDASMVDQNTVVLIPNVRMVDMLASVTEDDYLAFLAACTRAALKAGYGVLVIAHERQDAEIGAHLCQAFATGVRSLAAKDPVRVKAIVGGASLVVSSRYHGLANALSQGVPAVGTSWSHKYAALFAEYGCSDGLWDVHDIAAAQEKMGVWLDSQALSLRREALARPAKDLKHRSDMMWEQVKSVLLAGSPSQPVAASP